MAGRFVPPSEQYFDDSGDILSGGKLYFYDSGTAVLKDTFSDPDGTTANANPVILDGAGRTPNIYLNGAYKLVVKTSADVQIEERDPVLAADDTTKGFALYNAVTVYSVDNIVRASNGLLYISIANSNQDNEPSATAAKWTQVQLLSSYNANETYAVGATVVDSAGDIYKGLTASNTGNTPASNPTNWGSTIATSGVVEAVEANAVELGRDTPAAASVTTLDAGNTDITGTLDVSDNIVIGTSGKGIDFSAAGGDVLAYYEEDTFTPVFADAASGGNVSSTVCVGRYVRVGKSVTVWVLVNNGDTTGLTAGNDIYIRGLPFTAESTGGLAFEGSVGLANATFSGYLTAWVAGNTSWMRIEETQSGVGLDFMTVSQWTDGVTDGYFSITYEIN